VAPLAEAAGSLLTLVGLNRRVAPARASNGEVVNLDDRAQRAEVWAIALMSLDDVRGNDEPRLRATIANLALAHGFFSVWMTVFADDAAMRRALIEAFPGTATSCFDAETCSLVSPRPNNGLPHAGKA
jgi:hypothetical protein